MCVGEGRYIEAVLTLNATNMIEPAPRLTYVITCWRPEKARNLFISAGLNDEMDNNIKFIYERDWDVHHPMLSTIRSKSHWFYQQALKFTALEIIDSDAFLIQDCDIVPLRTYQPFIDGVPNVRVESHTSSYQDLYVKEATAFLGIGKNYDRSYVSELFPYLKKDYECLKAHVLSMHKTDLLTALHRHGPMESDSIKWLSEYEILGIWKDHCDPSWIKEEQWFTTLEFNPSVIKFRMRPSKFMSFDQIENTKDRINRLTSVYGSDKI